MPTDALKRRAAERVDARLGALLGISRRLHENPETAWRENASTDMGNVSQRVRAVHPYLGIGSLPAVNHQPAFAAATVTPAADQAVRDGAVLLAQTAIDAVHLLNG
jgi:metal-dependent amidase/aminoacylase/carboxypeptidase family protein